MPIFLKVNHQLESRIQEIWQSGSEGGAKLTFVPTPILAQGLPRVYPGLLGLLREALKGRQLLRPLEPPPQMPVPPSWLLT
jgi:hypothetical protein